MAPNRTGRNLRCNIWSEIKIELKASLHGRTGLRSIPEPSLRTAIDQQRCCIAVSALRKGWNTTDVACAKRSLSRVSTAFVLQYFPARSFESLQVSKTYLLSVSWFSLDSCRYCVAIERGNSMRCNNRCSQCHSAILPFCWIAMPFSYIFVSVRPLVEERRPSPTMDLRVPIVESLKLELHSSNFINFRDCNGISIKLYYENNLHHTRINIIYSSSCPHQLQLANWRNHKVLLWYNNQQNRWMWY
jgi:hypothetical protein